MAERRAAGPQHCLAQARAVGVHEGKGGVVAHRADVSQVIGQPLEFAHHRPQPVRPGRGLKTEGGLGGAREGDLVGDRAVAAGASGERRGVVEARSRHPRFESPVEISQALLQPHDSLAAGREAKVARLDDPGMHRSDGDLAQALSFARQEGIGRRRRRRRRGAQGVAVGPAAVVEPGPAIQGALGFEAIEIADGPLQANRRRVPRADGREAAPSGGQRKHRRRGEVAADHGHVDEVPLAPKAEENASLVFQRLDRRPPRNGVDHRPRPRPMPLDGVAKLCQLKGRAHGSSLIRASGPRAGTTK